MSFKSKIDFCGLSAGNAALSLKSHDEGRSSTVVTCENDEGDTVDATVVGRVADPSNAYALKTDASNLEIKLGAVTSVDLGTASSPDVHCFLLQSVSIGTSNSGEVSISAKAVEVPANSVEGRTYTVTIPTLKRRNKAQTLCGLFELSGDKCHLQSASYEFAVNVTHTTVDGERVTFDVHGGSVKVSITAKQAGAVAPVITPGAGAGAVVVQTGESSESRPDSDYASVSAEVTKYLVADAE